MKTPLLKQCVAEFIGTFALLVTPLLPGAGIREFWDRTAGFQAAHQPFGTIWYRMPGLENLRPIVEGAAIALAVLVAFVPRRRTATQLAALGAAILLALELGHVFWSFLYIMWWAPFVLIAVLARQRERYDTLQVRTGIEQGGCRPSSAAP
jgi:hypothetical protein